MAELMPKIEDINNRSWPCPAKLNLFLHFIGQREDGYHLLQSYFQLLDYSDDLHISLIDSDTIKYQCNIAELNTGNNLVCQAAKILKPYTDGKTGADIKLFKRLPIGGGVGGGSSDAATCLLVLNRLWQCHLSLDKLAHLGEQLGADIPFFVRGKSAFVEGIGEQITPYPIDSAWFLVIQPNCHISTQNIFSDPMLTRNSKAITIRDLKAQGLPFCGKNSMQSIVCNANKTVENALDWLKQHKSNARMTGSGSSLFAVFDNQEEASKIAALCDPSWISFVARGVNQSSIHQTLGYTD